MKWTKLKLQNFLSIDKVELDLNNRGLVLIEGRNTTNNAFQSNGSGKTSLMEGIIYALYDTTSKGIKADAVINRVINKNTYVILEGKRGDDVYRIERYRKHYRHKNKVKLFLNNEDISEKSVKDTNDKIERIIGIDYNTFINSIMFSQGNGAGRFATSTDKEKKEILENLVNLNIYAIAQEVAKEKVKEWEDKITQNKRQQEKMEWELEGVDKLEQQDKDNYNNTLNIIQQEEANIERLEKEKEEYRYSHFAGISDVEERVGALRAELRRYENSTDNSHLQSMVMNKSRELSNEVQQLDLYEKQKEELVNNYRKVNSDTNCPVCGSPLDSTHRENELENIVNQLRKVIENMEKLKVQVSNTEKEYKKLNADFEKQKSIQEQSNSRYREIMQAIQVEEKRLTDYNNTVKRYEDNIKAHRHNLEALKSVPEPVSRDAERETIRENIKAHKQTLLSLEKEKKKFEDVVKVYSNSGVKSHVLDLITPFLNKRANTYLAKLSGSDIEIEFSTQTRNKNGELADKFDVRVTNSTGGETYQANSEGEKKRIDLSISLAIQDLVMSKSNLSTNLVVYDEVFDALDSVGSENVIELLKDRLDKVGTIFVITHNEHLKNLFEQVITVTKDREGISSVVEGEGTT